MDLKDKIYKALENVQDPEIHKSLIELGMIKDVTVENGDVLVVVSLTIAGCPLKSKIGSDIKEELGKIEDIRSVEVKFGEMTPEEKQKLMERLHGKQKEPFKGVRVIAVGSGKGGVGKSTVTANLAISLGKLGYKVGLIDADIVGYSIPQILGIENEKPTSVNENLIMPIEKYGIKIISMGNFVDPTKPIIWRAPLLNRALDQFFNDVYWGELDLILMDLPPGTGDVPLSVLQKIPHSEILLVTTPQVTAAGVSKRLAVMASKMEHTVIGLIENMSYFICDNCGKEHYIFGKGESDKLGQELGIAVIGKIPLIAEKQLINANSTLFEIYIDIAKRMI